MNQVEDEEPALLLIKWDTEEGDIMLLNESHVVPTLQINSEEKQGDSVMWYLYNGACNQMTGHKSKFTELKIRITYW